MNGFHFCGNMNRKVLGYGLKREVVIGEQVHLVLGERFPFTWKYERKDFRIG